MRWFKERFLYGLMVLAILIAAPFVLPILGMIRGITEGILDACGIYSSILSEYKDRWGS